MSKWFICKDFVTTLASSSRRRGAINHLIEKGIDRAGKFLHAYFRSKDMLKQHLVPRFHGDPLGPGLREDDARVEGLLVRHANQFLSFGFVISLLLLSLQTMASPETLQQLSQKLNSIQTLQSKFVQINPNGQMLEGAFYLQKPGKMRFEYSGVSPFMLMADGEYLIYHDLEMNEAAYLDLDKNPLSILLKNHSDLRKIKDVQIKSVAKEGGKTSVEVFYPQENTTVILHFNEQLLLEGWVTHDAQGTVIDVRLHDVVLNKPIANAEKLFSFDRLKLKRRLKRGRGD